MLGGLAALFTAASAATLGRAIDAAYTGVMGVFLLLAGARMRASPKRRNGNA
jgi:hypothetical protein